MRAGVQGRACGNLFRDEPNGGSLRAARLSSLLDVLWRVLEQAEDGVTDAERKEECERGRSGNGAGELTVGVGPPPHSYTTGTTEQLDSAVGL